MALVALRGRLFESIPEGGCWAWPSPRGSRAPLPGRRAVPCRGQRAGVVCGRGAGRSHRQLKATLRAAKIAFTRVPFRVAAHSPMVEPILAEFEAFVRTIPLNPPRTPFVSNLTGTWITDAEATDAAYWARHLRETVRFSRGIAEILETTRSGPRRDRSRADVVRLRAPAAAEAGRDRDDASAAKSDPIGPL